MNKKIRKLLREVQRRGGLVILDESTPDDVAETFLNEVLRCPCCCARTDATKVVTRTDGQPRYGVVAGDPQSRKTIGH